MRFVVANHLDDQFVFVGGELRTLTALVVCPHMPHLVLLQHVGSFYFVPTKLCNSLGVLYKGAVEHAWNGSYS